MSIWIPFDLKYAKPQQVGHLEIMHPVIHDIAAALKLIEDEIIYVGALLETHPPDNIDAHVAAMDRALRKSYEASEATAKYLCILRTPTLEKYSPVEVVRGMSAQHPAAYTRKDEAKAVRVSLGDAEQVAELLRLLVENAELGEDATLHCEVACGDGAPRIVFSLDGPADFGDKLRIGEHYAMALEEFGHRWTAASSGGHIARAPHTLKLSLEGEGDAHASPPAFDRAAPVAKKLARSLRSWRGAIGNYEPGYASGEDIIALYRDTLHKTHALVLELRDALGAG